MPRRHRLTPEKHLKHAPWRFTATDKAVLTRLAQYRYLKSLTLQKLTGRPIATVNYSLRKLFDRRLIDKPHRQVEGFNHLNAPDIYEINARGRRWLTEEVPEVTTLSRTHTEGPPKHFAHSVAICDALAEIELEVATAGNAFIPAATILAKATVPNPLKMPCTIEHTFPNGKHERLETFIIPDGVYGVRYPDGRSELVFLEVERCNPRNPQTLFRASLLRKTLSYRALREAETARCLGKKSFGVRFIGLSDR
ncbi:replication-relaxation family protein [Rhodophyticola porphyridii]|uniref:Uncharacterized protein n=1 Tax=Rhodophyticola porphyridii TaxID=1852017 RepID=A0A3L9Y860_9RHOB|nr:replication-relaxation family protein [Rhodophyticola porphyridii]RMA43287.1 hypothetical protein D9R08_06650 [Rhodophyticola porphyridii]